MRNPKWHRDEIILALDLYFKLDPGQIHSRNPLIVELSETLNKLPIFAERPDEEKFRNPNGASMKLSNFLAIDTTYSGKGMKGYSKNDNEVFLEFNNNRSLLSNIADKIKTTLKYDYLIKTLNSIEDDIAENHIPKEGKVLYKLHKYRERNNKLVEKKKTYHKKKHGNISCEKCGFDFEQVYGILGRDFIECHHIVPLFKLEVETETKLDDLKLLCSNCHRMEHRKLKTKDI